MARAGMASEARAHCAEFAAAVEGKARTAIARFIFPNEDFALRLLGELLAEINDEWQERRDFAMGEFHEWLAERQTDESQDNATAVNGFRSPVLRSEFTADTDWARPGGKEEE